MELLLDLQGLVVVLLEHAGQHCQHLDIVQLRKMPEPAEDKDTEQTRPDNTTGGNVCFVGERIESTLASYSIL